MDKINEIVDSIKDSLVDDVRQIVSIKSTRDKPLKGMPFGEGVGKALDKALEISARLGFRTVNVDGYMGYAEYGEGSEIVGVLGHLDVVPEGDGWNYPPYGGELHGGRIYGRGAIDDKGPIISALYGLKAVKESALPLSKRVRILFGTNEENGSSEVPYYLKKEEAPTAGFTPDAEYPIIYAEKGILMFRAVKHISKRSATDISIRYLKGGNAPNMVPDYCEAEVGVGNDAAKKDVMNALSKFITATGYDITYEDKGGSIILKSKGVSAHGSTPERGKNAVIQLVMFLSGLDIDGDAEEYIDFFAYSVGTETNGKTLGMYLKDDTGELTFNLGVMDIDESHASASLNIRYPVTKSTDDVMDRFNEKAEPYGIEVKDMLDQHPLYFPQNTPLIVTLQKVYKEQTGLEPTLLAIGGGTYAKEMPGIVAFGPIFPGKPDLDHQANEYIEVDDLVMNAKVYGNAIYELAK